MKSFRLTLRTLPGCGFVTYRVDGTVFFSHGAIRDACLSPVPFLGLRLSPASANPPGHPAARTQVFFLRKECDEKLGHCAKKKRESERIGRIKRFGVTDGESRDTMGKQHYWLFKMVFTENNQFEGIMGAIPRHDITGYKNISRI